MLELNSRDCRGLSAHSPFAPDFEPRLLRAGPSRMADDSPNTWCMRPRLLEALTAAGSERRRRELVQAELQAIGFDEIGFGSLDISRGTPIVRSFCGHYADTAWIERYFARRYQDVDPRLRAIERSSLPCVWTLNELARQPVAAAQKAELCALVDDLHERGVVGGLMLALPALPGQARRFVSLLSRGAPVGRLDDAALGRVLMLALCLEEFHGTLPGVPGSGDEDSPTGELSPTQAQILDLLSRGMGDKQIAARLDISRHNVDYHLRRLRKRFGARNRVQLMQAALRVQPTA
ncbi:autoinducer binding domain-containing protein [Ideonella sp.]|uniref:helix-turn-helix transcriptional regulator n=1 Tax=Ideonella sp. TaxID=1929293 RepID=UPI0035B45513